MYYLIQKLFTLSLISTYFVAYIALADPDFGFNSSNPNGMLTLGQVNQPTSANDFKSKVKSLGQKNRNELSQQFKQELTQQQQPTTQPQAAATPQPTTTASPEPAPGTPVIQAPINAPDETVSPTFSTAAPGASPPPESTNLGTPSPPPPTGQGQIYTGFGAGTGTATPPPSGQTSGGWNIKY